LEEHPTRPVGTNDLVRNGRSRLGQLHHVALRGVHGLADRLGYFVRLSGGDAYPRLAVADRDEGIEREPPAAFHHLRHAIDGDDVLNVIAGVLAITPIASSPTPAAALTTASATAARPFRSGPFRWGGRVFRRLGRLCRGRLFCHLELQSTFASAVCDGLHATMV